MMDAILDMLGPWSRLAQAAPWRWGLGALGLLLALGAAGSALARAWIEARSDRVAAGPIFALAGMAVLALSALWWAVDAVLARTGQPLLEEHLLLLLAPAGSEDAYAEVRARLFLRDGDRLLLPGPVHLPIALLLGGLVYLAIVVWAGRALAELVALENKPDDILARERAEQQTAIAKALKEGKPIPAGDVVSVPLADDRFGRTFKLLGHWTSVEYVEERFVRWQGPLVAALTATLVLALPSALAGHLGAPIWVGAAIALDGLRRNLRTPKAPPAPPPRDDPAPPTTVAKPALLALIEVVHRDAGPLFHLPSPALPQPAQISPGTNLNAKRILEELRRELSLTDGLYVHQGLACDAFAARRNVLLATPPLSGKQTLLDLLVFYTLLVEAENVLYVAPSAGAAAVAERRFRQRAEAAHRRWNVHAANLSGRAGGVDLARSQPSLVFVDPQAMHHDICGHQTDWRQYLGSLGLVVIADIETHHGPRGAHLAQLLRRLHRAVDNAAPAIPCSTDRTQAPGAGSGSQARSRASGERVRFIATAAPIFRDLGRFAERIVGRPFLVLGAEVDGAPQPERLGYFLPAALPRSDLHPAVHVLGEALAQGFAAELFGYDDVLSASDVARANEVMLSRGVATRGRGIAGEQSASNPGAALEAAQVVIARASAARYATLALLTSHVGFRAGRPMPARIASLGAGEHVGAAVAPPAPASEQAPEDTDGALETETLATGELENKTLVLWQPDLDPLSALLARERPAARHDDLKHGCTLVADPLAEPIQRAHLRCMLAEGEVRRDELSRSFSQAVVETELLSLRGAGLIERVKAQIDPATGAPVDVPMLSLTGAHVHHNIALDAVGPALCVIDRHTGEVLSSVARERGLSVAYPGRIFIRAGRRFVVLPREQQDRIDEGSIGCEREEQPLVTSKIRKLAAAPIERRGGDRRDGRGLRERGQDEPLHDEAAEDRRSADRRAGPARSLGGAEFTLQHLPVVVTEQVLGVRRHLPDGTERDCTLFACPIESSYATRAAVLGFPARSFGELDEPVLHALAHLFRVTLPPFVHHLEDDLEVAWLLDFGPSGEPALAFVDGHPGGAGFADAVTLDVVRHLVRWSGAIVRRCPGGCSSGQGCLRCLQHQRCHAEPERRTHLDKLGASRILSLIDPSLG